MKLDVHLEREGDSEMFEDLARYLKYHPTLTRFLFNPAGFTFLFGVILYLGMIIGWIGLTVVDASIARNAAAVAGTQMFFGREIAIPTGIELAVPVLLVAGIAFTQDLVTTAWVYPLFYLYRRRNLGRESFSGYFFQRMEEKAQKHRAFIERYGAVGLYFFMLIPFAVNGPLIGAIVGKLAGIRTRYILPTVVLATFTATTIITLAYLYARGQFLAFEHQVGGRLTILALMLTIVALVVLVTFLNFVRDHRRFRRLQRERAELAREQAPRGDAATSEAAGPGPSEGR